MKPVFFFMLLFTSIVAFAKEKKTVYFPNGKVQYEYEMEGHLFDGKFTCYFETGKLRIKGQFLQNQKTGLWRVWDEKGLLRSERNYTDNKNFIVVSESDSSGVKVRRNIQVNEAQVNDVQDILFSQRYISSIEKSNSLNAELFAEKGYIDEALNKVIKGDIMAFVDDRFAVPVNKPTITCYNYSDVVAVLVKEDYRCNASNQTMVNKISGICPVVMEKGKRKEVGWIYVPELKIESAQLTKLNDHLYASTFIKTTVNDPSYKFRDVAAKENDLLRLMLLEFEANAILYAIDQQILASK